MKKCGIVSMFGKPNAGKSTLLNLLLKYDLAVVNKKAQTTRNKIAGVLTEGDTQIIFNDTPGILEPEYELQNFMHSEIVSSVKDADVVLFVSDIRKVKSSELAKTLSDYKEALGSKSIILVLTKCDRISQQEILLKIKDISSFSEKGIDIVPVSSTNGYNIDGLKKVIIEKLPEGEFLYDDEFLTDRSERFFVSEIIREKILTMFHEEIPYSVFVNIVEFKERDDNKDYINAEIIVEREPQKIILIGSKGASLKRLGESSRIAIEKFLGRKIYLELFVKVRKGWRENREFIRNNMGEK
ncbi:GTPase Era [soil metagenome]